MDRTVLIPFGSKAFFPGSLQPKMGQDRGDNDGLSSELVVLTQQDGTQQEISRNQALQKLQEEMDELVQSKKKKTPLKSALKASSSASRKGATRLPKNATAPGTSGDEATSPVFPYFEIREELDNAGNEIRSEAIDVSKHLEYLRQNPNVADSELVPPVNQTTPMQQNESLEEIPVEDDDVPRKKLTDQEFDALSARLEELARLEEESEKEKYVESSKKLQSSSWSKGFFNKPAKKKQIQTKTSAVSVEKKQGTGTATITKAPTEATTKPIESSVFTGVIKERSSKKPLPQETTSSKLKPLPPPPNAKEESKVRFQDTPSVQEIPRIGRTPVSLLKNHGASMPRQAVQTSPITTTTTKTILTPTTTTKPPKKKLSRFAMERKKLR